MKQAGITKESLKSLLEDESNKVIYGNSDDRKVWLSHAKDLNRCASVTLGKYHGIAYYTVRYFTETRAYIEQFINLDAVVSYLRRRQLSIVRM